MIQLLFKRWADFLAEYNRALIRAWLEQVGNKTHLYFRGRMEASRGGRRYTQELRTIRGRVVPVGPRLRGPHTASAPGDYPAKDTGRLIGSIRRRVTADEMEIGTGMFYAKFLKYGTRRMAKRKMSSDALRETLPGVRPQLRGFARWRR